ncbi:MAG TPA: DUF2089 domain-containing protein [Chitinispirillaceae bacterium]|nr:DUF2089 domain-containing protein [Chitinispirillaceae bacterium]
MSQGWQVLSKMVDGQEIVVNRVTVRSTAISIEGEFELPPLARLSFEDQVFIGMFIKTHGSIKEMEQAFGISYPTVKARLNRISESLGFIESKKVTEKDDVLARLERGEITVVEAMERLSK